MKKTFSILLALTLLCSLVMSVCAAPFVDSVHRKPAPEITDPTIIVHPDGSYDEVKGLIIITPISEADNAKYQVITDRLYDAYGDFTSVSSLGQINGDLDGIARKINPKYSADNFVISDLFDLFVEWDDVIQEGDYLIVTLNTSSSSFEDIPVIMIKDGDVWNVLDESRIIRNENGTISLKLFHTGPMAFLRIQDNAVVSGSSAEKSPQTGENYSDSSNIILFAGILSVLLCASLAVVLIVKKKKN